MRILFLLALSLCAAPAIAQPDGVAQMLPEQPPMNPQNQPDVRLEPRVRPTEVDAQIKQDVEDLAFDFGRSEFAIQGPFRVYGARQGFFGASAWLDDISIAFSGVRVVVIDVSEVRHNGDDASAIIRYAFEVDNPDTLSAKALAGWQSERREPVQFKREFGPEVNEPIWKIVPPATAPGELTMDKETPQDDNFWSIAAYHLAQKQPYQPLVSPAERSIRKLEVLCLGAMMLNVDFDGIYAFEPQYAMPALSFYIPQIDGAKPAAFQVPETNEIYNFNAALSNRRAPAERVARQTVLFYEGQNETPIFRYNGRATIGFADGHAALVTPDEAKQLIWKP